MNRKKCRRVSDCHTRSLRGCKSVLLFFCILRAERGCCGVIVVGKGNVASIGNVATPGRNAYWGVPQTPKKRGETMANRTRKIVLRVPVTPEERELIRQKMALLHTRNFSAYARKMLIDGYVVHIDTTDIRAQTAELQKIGVNINQIARRLNSMASSSRMWTVFYSRITGRRGIRPCKHYLTTAHYFRLK